MRLLIVTVLLLLSATGKACSCMWTETFCQYTKEAIEWSGGSTVVARVRLLHFGNAYRQGYFPLYDLEILEVYTGDIEQGERVSLLGQDGGNCNGSFPEHATGEQFVVMFANIPDQYVSYYQEEKIDHPYPIFDLPGCGPSVLMIDRGRASGRISDRVSSVSLGAVKRTLASCVGQSWVVSPDSTDAAPYRVAAAVYPNPTRDYFEVKLATSSAIFRIDLYDILGRLIIREDLKGEVINEHKMRVDGLAAGTYVLVMETEGIRVKEQVVVY